MRILEPNDPPRSERLQTEPFLQGVGLKIDRHSSAQLIFRQALHGLTLARDQTPATTGPSSVVTPLVASQLNPRVTAWVDTDQGSFCCRSGAIRHVADGLNARLAGALSGGHVE